MFTEPIENDEPHITRPAYGKFPKSLNGWGGE